MKIMSRQAVVAAALVLAAGSTVRADADAAAAGRVGLAEMKKDLDAGKVVVIDVRSAEAYRAGHIPGSLNVPLNTLDEHVARLKAARKPIVAYCA
ncbi:MAG TPA: rhodanese-like domain-containing protein [Vicinamibacteria bacterium]|nr:rhodanese-like domain-containing protein [Vicinamibacteria bacterium]